MIALLLAGATMLARPDLLAPVRPACRQGALETAAPVDPALLFRPQDQAAARLRRLGDLPKPNLEIAVLRTVDGCAAPVVVRYSIGP